MATCTKVSASDAGIPSDQSEVAAASCGFDCQSNILLDRRPIVRSKSNQCKMCLVPSAIVASLSASLAICFFYFGPMVGPAIKSRRHSHSFGKATFVSVPETLLRPDSPILTHSRLTDLEARNRLAHGSLLMREDEEAKRTHPDKDLSSSRRAYLATFVVASLALGDSILHDTQSAHAFEVAKRSEAEIQQRQADMPSVRTYSQQLGDAITLKSMRGVWKLREYGKDGTLTSTGTLTFRGDPLSKKGTVSYDGDATAGRGPWIIKADGFGRSQTGKGGVIEMKALWKLRRGSAGSFSYAGRVNVPSYIGGRPDAEIEGDIIELVNGGYPKGGSERKVGRFEAIFRQDLKPEDDMADAGGARGVVAATVVTPASSDSVN